VLARNLLQIQMAVFFSGRLRWTSRVARISFPHSGNFGVALRAPAVLEVILGDIVPGAPY